MRDEALSFNLGDRTGAEGDGADDKEECGGYAPEPLHASILPRF